MSEQSAVVEATPTEVTPAAPVMEVNRGALVNMTGDERAEFRRTGELPKPKVEEAAPSSEPKPEQGEAKPAGDSEAPKEKQEHTERKPKPAKTADERIAELEATIEKIRKNAGKETPKAESSPAKPAQQPVQQQADKEPTPEDQNPDGTQKFKTYEEFTKAQARWEVRQELAEQRRLEAQQAQAKAFNAELEKARGKYANFDEVAGPLAAAIDTDVTVSPVVRQMFRDSDILPDLLYTIGGNEAESANFLKMAKEDPGKAIRYIALTESLITEELEGKAKPIEEPPAKPKTQAPKPPSEAGGRAAAPPDALESAAKAGDFRAYKAEANRRSLAKLKS